VNTAVQGLAGWLAGGLSAGWLAGWLACAFPLFR